MWRWIIRVYAAAIIFVLLMYVAGAIVLSVNRSTLRLGYYGFNHVLHEYPLCTMFLIGLAVGQVYLGSNITGRGWFRSKSGLTYEGFKLEALKPWSWLIVSPILFVGILFWLAIQNENGALSSVSWSGFYRGFLMPNCSNIRAFALGDDSQCALRLMTLGTWVAALGYSLAPVLRKRSWQMYGYVQHRSGASAEIQTELSMKAKAEKE